MPTTPDYEYEDPAAARQRRADAAARLDAGARVDAGHAVDLAYALLEIARLAMPGTYLAGDSRCQLARAVIDHATLDVFEMLDRPAEPGDPK
jgi:hypothetical protein